MRSTSRPLPSAPHRAELGPGENHTFEASLVQGELLDIELSQEDVDLSLRVLAPAGHVLRWADGPYGTRGIERVVLAADNASTYTIEISCPAESAGGPYELRTVRRLSGPSDASLLDASRVHAAGDTARRSEDWATAATAYHQAAAAWARAGYGLGETEARHRLGRIRNQQGDKPGALDAYVDAYNAARAAGFRVGMADLAYGIGRLRRDLDDLDGAIDAFEEAEALFAELAEPKTRARAANLLAGVLERRGELDRARRAYGRALGLARRHDTPRWQGIYLTNLGWAYLRLGQTELALGVFEEALDLRLQAHDRRGQGITLIDRGTAERRLGRLDDARRSFVEAWQVLLTTGDQTLKAYALMGLGWTDLERGRPASAERAFTSALPALDDNRYRRARAIALLGLAEVELERGHGPAANDFASRALDLFDALADRQGQASACFAIGRAERARGRPDVALRFYELALERIESVREQARVDPLKTSYLAFRRRYYEETVDLTVDLYRQELYQQARQQERQQQNGDVPWLELALATSERGRARSLLETLYLARSDLPRRLDPVWREREREAESRLIDLELERVRLDLEAGDAGDAAVLDRRLRTAALELAEARQALYDADPETARLLRPEPFDVRRFAASHLDADTVLLEISLGDERGHLFWIDRDGIEVHVLPGRERLDHLARQAHRALQQSHKPLGARLARPALRELSRVLLGPVAQRLERQRLVIVAEGALQYVPFGVLPDPRRLDDDGPVLLERHEIVSLPSASVLEILRRRRTGRPRATKLLGILADPVFSLADPRLTASASAAGGARAGGTSTPARLLERLPFTADEAASILAMIPEDQRFAALGFDAHLELVQSGALADYRIVHFATHGRLDTEHPELSGLELSHYDDAGRPRPGTLYAYQTYDVRLGADLVVLSACNTALGREVRGEGLLGLTRGFFHAGASRVVVSLWSVDDQATTELMIHFYRHLLTDGLPPSSALREAQLRLRADPRWASPYFWAGFILMGDWH